MSTLRYWSLTGFVALLVSLAGCGSGGRHTQVWRAQSRRIGVELPLLTSPFWQAYDQYLLQYAKRDGLALLAPSNANGDNGKFLGDVQSMLGEGVSGLVLSPTDTAAVVTSLQRAHQVNVPVVTVDVAPESGPVFMVVRADNNAYGQKACAYIGSRVRRGSVVQIEGDLASVNGRERSGAFDRCMKQRYPAIRVLEVAADWDASKAAQGLETVFTANPDIKAIYLQAGGVYLAPTLSYLRRTGALVSTGHPKHVIIVSNDGIPQELDAIRRGWIDATVSQPADSYAKYGLFYIKAALDGKHFAPGATDHGSTIVRLPGNMLEDQLPAPLVTKANVNDKAFWGNSLR